MQWDAGIPLAWISVVVLSMTLPGCATPAQRPIVYLPPSSAPSTVALRQAEDKGYSAGYDAGELAQALRDQAREKREASTLAAPASPPPPSPLSSPAPPPQDSFNLSGPAIPLSKVPAPF